MNKLYEYLNYDYNVPPYIVISKIENILGIKIFEVNGDYITNDIEYDDITEEQFKVINNIANIYLYNILIIEYDEKLHFIVHKPNRDRVYPKLNLYVHNSDVIPPIIKRLGLRTKNPYNNDSRPTVKKWVSSCDDHYRIYMCRIDAYINFKNNYKKLATDIFNDVLHDPSYGKYKYLIKLPKAYPVYLDPETLGDDDLGWVYTIYPVLSKYILYLGYLDDDYNIHHAVTEKDIYNFIIN